MIELRDVYTTATTETIVLLCTIVFTVEGF